MKYLLDTHVWIWWNMNPQKLSTRIRSLLSALEQYDSLLLSAISPWEFSKLLDKMPEEVCRDYYDINMIDVQNSGLTDTTQEISYSITTKRYVSMKSPELILTMYTPDVRAFSITSCIPGSYSSLIE